MAPSADAATPLTLHDLLSNSLLLRQISPYLPTASIFALARANKAFYALVHHSPDVFRYLDLSSVKSAVIPNNAPLDRGGNTWRAERMDEALTEDEFYSGPLLGIFSRLARKDILQHVHTLVLDGLSVPADLVREIVAEDRFSVRILSIREAEHLNERKLQQVLRYAVRPTRPAGTPRLKGLYVFGAKEPGPVTEPVSKKQRSPPRTPGGVMTSLGAQIGAEWNQRSSDALSSALARSEHHKWYQSAGRVLHKRPSAEWAETLKASTLTAMQQTEALQDMAAEGQTPKDIKIGVKRECFGCGPTCAECKALFIRACRTCRNEYCIIDNDGSSAIACDWCNYSGRRTRELY
ncbi:putative ubiquitin fusion degradation protein [Neofusicoccum parvum UCRNP2]|uniref:Putative ubiquitin fusion degradation protein n=1 Tax=Botryosphaeria parva (strain UCR-NP2) TaxID=1287680 RepID=R1EER4_BOTPV|nr:putative ubiquitin fusion degradation protein [Neofusicoccum parvum UCRNP2]